MNHGDANILLVLLIINNYYLSDSHARFCERNECNLGVTTYNISSYMSCPVVYTCITNIIIKTQHNI